MQARLASYRTLEMSSREMLLEFPPDPVAKAVMDGKLPMPQIPIAAPSMPPLSTAWNRNRTEAECGRVKPLCRTPQPVRQHGELSAQSNRRCGAARQPGSPSRAGSARDGVGDWREAHTLVDDLVLLPPDGRMQRILALPVAQQRDLTQGIPFEKRQALLAGLSPQQRETVMALNNPAAVINNEVQSAKLLRAVYSDRQLEEVLTDFWFNHFNVFIGKGADRSGHRLRARR